MERKIAEEAVGLGKKLGYVFLATSDTKGLPHLTIADEIALTSEDKIAVSSWFCPGTLANLKRNINVGIIIWDKSTDTGYQLLGKMEHFKDIAMLDGYLPRIEEKIQLPQEKIEVVINVERALVFRQAPHTDLPR